MQIEASNTSSYDDYTFRWLQLLNVLQDATPIVIKCVIPEGELETDATNDLAHETDDNIRYSQKLYKYLKKGKKLLSEKDQAFFNATPPNVFLKMLDFLRLRRILKKIFPGKWKEKMKFINIAIDVRNALIHEGKLTVKEEDDFQHYKTSLEECLIELGVLQEEIEKFKSIVIDPKMFKNIDDKEKEAQENSTNYEKFLASILTTMGKQDPHTLKEEDILPIKGSSPFESKSIELTEVFKQGKDDPNYGKHYQCVDKTVYYVDHEHFLIGKENENGRVYLGYHELQWIALKTVVTSGGKKPNELDKMIELGAHDNKHVNIIGVKKAFSDNKSLYYLVMELCDYNLNTYIKRDPPLSAQERCDIAKQLLEAITYLHYERGEKKSIIHRDLKPNNVLIKTFNDPKKVELKLADYGMSVARSDAEKTPMTKGVSAWKWYAPASSESENTPVWPENDVFVTNSLLAFILSSNHFHPYLREQDNEKDLRKRYEQKQTISEELEIYEEFRDFLNKNFQNYFEFYDIKEKIRELQKKDESTETLKEDVDNFKKNLRIANINAEFMKLYPVKNPNATRGKRYAIMVTCNKEKLRDEKVTEVIGENPHHLQSMKNLQQSAEIVQEMAFGGGEDATIIRSKLKDCNFNIKPNVENPNDKKILDMEQYQLMDIIDEIKEEISEGNYSGDVYLFLWILAHGRFDTKRNDTCFTMGANEDEVYVNELLCDINQKYPKLKTIAVIDCCRDEKNIKGNSNNTQQTNIPNNVIGLYSVPEGQPSGTYHTGTSYPWVFAAKVAQHIQPGTNIEKMFDQIIQEMREEKKRIPEKFLFDNSSGVSNFCF